MRYQYVYNHASLPPLPAETLDRLDQAAARLATCVKELDVSRLPLSDYGRENVADFQQKADETLKKYIHLLAWTLHPNLSGGMEAVIDYGGGHGLLACLAREAGFPRVIYNDIFSGCCADARQLAQELGCVADDYVCGDITAVSAAVQPLALPSAALISINVIEHIYDMDAFIREAGALVRGPMTLVLSTSANPLNPVVAKRHYRQHRLWEFTDGPHESSYPMDTLRAFRSVRRDLIRAAAPQISEPELIELTDRTRGMWKPDIEKCVAKYLSDRQLPRAPLHPTNTCDPLTGSWQERLLDIPHVSQTLAGEGFSVRVLGGYYGGHAAAGSLKSEAKRAAANLLNHAISALGPQGVRLAPCIIFHAARR